MSSTERAPEPTMEEILASIRRIISDDNTSSPPRAATLAAVEEDARPDGVDAEADTRIIDDIARVLSGGAPGGAADDDILDLTKEFGPADAAMDEGPPDAAMDLDLAAAAPQPDLSTGAAPMMPDSFPSDTYTSASYGSETLDNDAAEPMSALDQAIAALRAGMGVVSEAEPEAELVLTDVRVETIVAEPAAAMPEPEPEPEPAAPEPEPEPSAEEAFWPPATPSWAKNGEAAVAPAPPRFNGGSSHASPYAEVDFSTQSLQDSVKASLRPLLRLWLDAHMSRVLEAALRDELKDADENMSRMLTAALRDELDDVEARRRSS